MKAEEVINNTEDEKELAQSQIRQVADWFHENSGELLPKQKAISQLKNDLDIHTPQHLTKEEFYSQLIGDLVGDHVDPVQMVKNGKGKYVGVIDYSEHDTYYTYDEYHDIEGKYTRGVCAACIHKSSKSSEPFTRHTGKFGNEPYGDKEQLKKEMKIHVDAVHSTNKVEVETGATLASGTTIAGNAAFHAGNDGSGSGLNADLLDGNEADDLGVTIEQNGTVISDPSTGINFDTGLDAVDDGDGTVTVTGASALSELTIDADKDWQNFDIYNVRKFTAEDGMVMDKVLETNESFIVETNESMVVSEEYTVQSGGTLTIEDGGSMTVM